MRKYIFKPYSKSFPQLFLKEKQRIFSHLKEDLQIEHVGSSAVPGLAGKGIIDIAIATEKKDQIVNKLQELGYDFRLEYSTESRFFFKIQRPDLEEGKRTYHIHVMSSKSKEWLDVLFFRDYLKDHPQDAKRYADLKERASLEAHEHGEKYRKLKDPFIQEILQKRSFFFNDKST